MADNRVLEVLEDREGRLWFGTPDGASRFDGARWLTERDSIVRPGTASPEVLAMLIDRQGRHWFGTKSGLSCFDGTRWTRYSSADRLPVDEVNALLEDHRGEIWIGTFGGLVRHDPATNQWQTIVASPTGLVFSWAWRLLEDRNHSLWIATPRGVSCLDETRTQWTRYLEDPAALARDSVLSLAEDRTGAIWFGTDAGAFRLRNGAWTHFTTDSGLASPAVIHIRATREGPVWFGGFTGLTRYDGKAWRPYALTSDGQPLGQILSLFEDSVGNLWIGTYTAGLFRYDGVAWRNYFSTQISCSGRLSQNAPFQYTLGSNCLNDVLQDRQQDLWFATGDGGASRYDRRGRWMLYTRGPGTPISDSIGVMVEDAAGNLWFGSMSSGLARLDATRTQWQTFSRAEGLPGDSLFCIAQDRRGDLWVGSATGAGRWDGTNWFRYLTGAGAVYDGIQVLGVLEDTFEGVWLRTTEGLYRIPADRSAARRITTAEGLLSDEVTTLAMDRSGRVWVGTTVGVSIFDGDAWTSHSSVGLGNASVTSLFEDSKGRMWAATNAGVACWNGVSWTSFSGLVLGASPLDVTEHGIFEDDRGSIWVSTFMGAARYNGESWRLLDSRGDGLAFDQVTRFFQDAQGHLWMLSQGGLTEHEVDRVAPQTIFLSGPDRLTTSQNAAIVFGAAYGEAADVEFETSWDGGPFSTWSPSVTWGMLGIPDGVHALRVRAREWLRNQDPTVARYEFEVDATPPTAILSSPTFGAAVRDTLEIRGVAADPRFRQYRVQARPAGAGSWTGLGVIPLDSSLVQAVDRRLALWETKGVEDGFYDLRLAVIDTLGLIAQDQVTVLVDNHAPFAEVTAPQAVSALEGGDVYSTLGEVHLYFPPRAFVEDAQVSITARETPPPGGPATTPLTGTWGITWSKELLKPVTLEITVPSGNPPTPPPAIFRQEGSGWTRVGGTFDPAGGVVAAAISQAGGYALMPDAAPPSGSGGVSLLAISPRVLSLSGSSARRAAISFTLARSGPTTISVFNRAGRRVRELAQAVVLGAGANLVYWDGLDQGGRAVDDGLYIVGVEALGEVHQKHVGVVR